MDKSNCTFDNRTWQSSPTCRKTQVLHIHAPKGWLWVQVVVYGIMVEYLLIAFIGLISQGGQ